MVNKEQELRRELSHLSVENLTCPKLQWETDDVHCPTHHRAESRVRLHIRPRIDCLRQTQNRIPFGIRRDGSYLAGGPLAIEAERTGSAEELRSIGDS